MTSGGICSTPIFAGELPMRVAMFVSSTGANLRTVIRLANVRPDILEIALVVTDKPSCDAVALAQAEGLPLIARDFATACGRASAARTKREHEAYQARARAFHDDIDAELGRHERRTRPLDLLVLAYHHWIHGRLLERFENRIINQHPGDLRALDARGRRILKGNNPVLAALRHGHRRVRTTTFLVDAGCDSGTIVCQGPWVPVGAHKPTQVDADQLELAQKRLSDMPSLICALTAIASGSLAVDHQRRAQDNSRCLSLGGKPLPFGGIDLDDPLRQPNAAVDAVMRQVRENIARCG